MPKDFNHLFTGDEDSSVPCQVVPQVVDVSIPTESQVADSLPAGADDPTGDDVAELPVATVNARAPLGRISEVFLSDDERSPPFAQVSGRNGRQRVPNLNRII